MPYGTRNNGQIQTFWPDDTEDEFYLDYSTSIKDILERIEAKWGKDIDPDKVQVGFDYIHTDCLTHDLYDPSDYTKFLRVSRSE